MQDSSSLTRRVCLAAAALAPFAGARAAVEAWPARPVRLVIPFPAGGATDYAARALGEGLSALWRQPVVCDNRAGAGSTLGTQLGAKAPADGYTLVMGVPAGVSIAPHIYPRLGYDPLVDLAPIAGFARSPLVLVVPADSPLKTVADLLRAARARPGALSYASNGSGSLPHLATEWLATRAGVQLLHVPYRGSALALPDLVAGRTQLMLDIIVSALPLIEAGRLRALAVSGAQRTTLLPGVPTLAESGLPGFAVEQWYGLFAPAGTPPAIISRIENDVASVTADSRIRAQLWRRGADVVFDATAALARAVRADHARWAEVARTTGARAD